jgi:hypothetical protein
MAELVDATVTVRLDGLKKYRSTIDSNVKGASGGPIRDAIRQWGARFRSFVQRRFVKYSAGGGDWPPLKSKRSRGALAAAAILRNTGLLFSALLPTFQQAPGQHQKDIPFGVEVGYGGPGSYPSGASIVDIANFHQTGAGFLPVRKIIVRPDQSTINQMAQDMERALLKTGSNMVTR